MTHFPYNNLATSFYNHKMVVFLCATLLISSCNKLVEIAPPVNTIVTSQAFNNDKNAITSVLGIYTSFMDSRNNGYFANGGLTIYLGLSSDELAPFGGFQNNAEFYNNSLQPGNGELLFNLWQPAYESIYQINACIEGLNNAVQISTVLKKELLGEVKFLRALHYFYLVNLWGDIPYVESTQWKETSIAGRSSKTIVYEKITQDLLDAQQSLPDLYPGNGERTRANKAAATALLARVYLYQEKWDQAVMQATSIIDNSSIYSLSSELNSVFLRTSPEAILQWELNTVRSTSPYNATSEGAVLIPRPNRAPTYFITMDLLNGFEANDQRKNAWINSLMYEDQEYLYPYKYKIGRGQASPDMDATEYYIVLRLAEQYLIRAEARARVNNLIGAAEDIDVIRARAGLINTTAMTQEELLAAVAQERRVELFLEWGHRWLDLKRTGKATQVLGPIKPFWQAFKEYYPFPFRERLNNPNLTQNEGY